MKLKFSIKMTWAGIVYPLPLTFFMTYHSKQTDSIRQSYERLGELKTVAKKTKSLPLFAPLPFPETLIEFFHSKSRLYKFICEAEAKPSMQFQI